MNRGFVITFDAIIAISFFLLAIIILTSQSYQPRSPGGIYLKQLNFDVITVLEKTGKINLAFGGNTSAIQEVIEATPKLACMDISILNASDDIVVTAVKSDCNETVDLDIQTSARSVIYQDNLYIIKSKAWFRKEPI